MKLKRKARMSNRQRLAELTALFESLLLTAIHGMIVIGAIMSLKDWLT
jgi:hypothetical protein